MSKFYTNVTCYGDNILYRGVQDGRRFNERVKFKPSFFVQNAANKQKSEYTNLKGDYLQRFDFDSIKEARDFYQRYKDVESFKLFGNNNYEYVYIGEKFKGPVLWDRKYIRVCNIDIEVDSTDGFPYPEKAEKEITAITMRLGGKVYAFACKPLDRPIPGVIYYQCDNEIDLIDRFLEIWSLDYPDIITGWNVNFFDIPYLINRITKLCGEAKAKLISPWKFYYKRSVILMGKEHESYIISGIATLDYIELYRKFDRKGQSVENYKLDTIANVVLGEKKLSYAEYSSLYRLYQENFQLFMEYNVRDTELVENLDNSLKLIDLALTLAYDSKSNYADVFMQTRMWDNIIYNWLKEKNIAIPQQSSHEKTQQFIGADVKEPQSGMHKWVVSFDLTSLYPHIQMGWNLSTETLLDPSEYPHDIKMMMSSQTINIDTMLQKKVDLSALKKHNLTVTPNGQIFRRDIHGFMPQIIEKMFSERKAYKNKQLELEKELESVKQKITAEEKKRYENDILKYNHLQENKKICLNSSFGAQGSEYFRFYDIRQAEAITTYGQLIIRWGRKYINEYLNKIIQTINVDYVIASDTDSVYLTLDSLVSKYFDTTKEMTDAEKHKIVDFIDKICKDKIQPTIDKIYKNLVEYTNAYEHKLIMKREKICDIGICISGKNYIWNVWDKEGIRYKEPKTDIVGLQMIKSKTPELARNNLKKVIPFILSNRQDLLHDFLDKFRKEFMKALPEEIATPTSMKGIDKYKDPTGKQLYILRTPVHVRASLLYNKYLKEKKLDKTYPEIKDGEKIKFVYLKMPNPIKENVIGFPTILPKEFDLEKYIDYNAQYENAVVSPLKAVLDVIGWSVERQSSLDSLWE